MARIVEVNPDNPQLRLLTQAAATLRQGGVLVYPTDSGYALGCHLEDNKAKDRILRIRQLSKKHNFSILCRDLSELAQWARVGNGAYRLIRRHVPGAYTFILRASADAPRKLLHPKRKTIGVRVPAHSVTLALLEALGEPIMTTSLVLPGVDKVFTEAYMVQDYLGKQVDLIIDSGPCAHIETTVVDLTDDFPVVIREGGGDTSTFI